MKPYEKQKIINEIKRLSALKSRYTLSEKEVESIDKMIKYLSKDLDSRTLRRYVYDTN